MTTIKYVTIIIIFLASTNSWAALHKWVDADGKVHYSDVPPAKADVEVSQLRTGTDESSSTASSDEAVNPSLPQSAAEREAELKKSRLDKKAAAEKVAKEKEYDQALKASCERAQQNLRVLEDDVRLVEIDASGERSYISDEQRQANIAKTKDEISKYCR